MKDKNTKCCCPTIDLSAIDTKCPENWQNPYELRMGFEKGLKSFIDEEYYRTLYQIVARKRMRIEIVFDVVSDDSGHIQFRAVISKLQGREIWTSQGTDIVRLKDKVKNYIDEELI